MSDKLELRRNQVRNALVANQNARHRLSDMVKALPSLRESLRTLDSYEDEVIDSFPVHQLPEAHHLATLQILLSQAQSSVEQAAASRAWLIGFDAAEAKAGDSDE